MRTFFKSMIANQRKTTSPVVKNRNKPPQLIYFESELTRLMKTVPGLRDDQVKEIVEYLSSEDTWSDSYDSSDYTSSDLEAGTKKNPFQRDLNVPNINNMHSSGFQKDSDLMYHCLMSSFQRIDPSQDSSTTQSRNSPPLINKVMQHIGTRLVALMHEVSEGAATPKGRYHRRLQPKLPTISTTTEEEDSLRIGANDRSDSRTRLPSTGENSSSALVVAAAKRRSAGDLLFKSGNNSREHLDRVRSCGSIGGSAEDKIWSMRHPRKRRSSVPDAASNSGESADGENDSDDEDEAEQDKILEQGKSTTLPRTLQTSMSMASTTNSLPRLSSTSPVSPSIYKVNSVHQFNVKSARYRPPGYARNSGSMTICAPPRREYGRRRPSPHQLSPSILASMVDILMLKNEIFQVTGGFFVTIALRILMMFMLNLLMGKGIFPVNILMLKNGIFQVTGGFFVDNTIVLRILVVLETIAAFLQIFQRGPVYWDDECEKSPRHRVSTISVVSIAASFVTIYEFLLITPRVYILMILTPDEVIGNPVIHVDSGDMKQKAILNSLSMFRLCRSVLPNGEESLYFDTVYLYGIISCSRIPAMMLL
ncbi:Sytl5p [Sarracenia purpurea var. burkii]